MRKIMRSDWQKTFLGGKKEEEKEEEEEDMDPKELRRLPIEQHNQQTNLWTNQKYPAISAELLALL